MVKVELAKKGCTCDVCSGRVSWAEVKEMVSKLSVEEKHELLGKFKQFEEVKKIEDEKKGLRGLATRVAEAAKQALYEELKAYPNSEEYMFVLPLAVGRTTKLDTLTSDPDLPAFNLEMGGSCLIFDNGLKMFEREAWVRRLIRLQLAKEIGIVTETAIAEINKPEEKYVHEMNLRMRAAQERDEMRKELDKLKKEHNDQTMLNDETIYRCNREIEELREEVEKFKKLYSEGKKNGLQKMRGRGLDDKRLLPGLLGKGRGRERGVL